MRNSPIGATTVNDHRTEDERVEHVGPFRVVDAIDGRFSQHAAFVTVVVEGADGRRYSYNTSCLYYDLKPYEGSATP